MNIESELLEHAFGPIIGRAFHSCETAEGHIEVEEACEALMSTLKGMSTIASACDCPHTVLALNHYIRLSERYIEDKTGSPSRKEQTMNELNLPCPDPDCDGNLMTVNLVKESWTFHFEDPYLITNDLINTTPAEVEPEDREFICDGCGRLFPEERPPAGWFMSDMNAAEKIRVVLRYIYSEFEVDPPKELPWEFYFRGEKFVILWIPLDKEGQPLADLEQDIPEPAEELYLVTRKVDTHRPGLVVRPRSQEGDDPHWVAIDWGAHGAQETYGTGMAAAVSLARSAPEPISERQERES